MPCKACPPGTKQINNTYCESCESGQFSTPDGKDCQACPHDEVPIFGIKYSNWTRLPPRLSTYCIDDGKIKLSHYICVLMHALFLFWLMSVAETFKATLVFAKLHSSGLFARSQGNSDWRNEVYLKYPDWLPLVSSIVSPAEICMLELTLMWIARAYSLGRITETWQKPTHPGSFLYGKKHK